MSDVVLKDAIESSPCSDIEKSQKVLNESHHVTQEQDAFVTVLTNEEPEPQDIPDRVSEEIAHEAVLRCEKVVESLRASSPSGRDDIEDVVAPFALEELDLGQILGSGEFSSVYEITSFLPAPGSEKRKGEQKARTFLAKHARREKTRDARYAIKHLRKALLGSKEKFLVGAQDLAMEAQLLQCIQHPHIIKLRGLAASGWSGFATGRNTGFFLILDRLNDTLQQRLCTWKQNHKKYQRYAKFLVKRQTKMKRLLETRIKVAYDIAGALAYLHEKSIIYRDLKPVNLGFDIRGDIKLFDFGLAKEIPLERENENQRFRLSGAGSLRYMAPEVVRVEPYNLKVDVYSFSVLLWEILALQVPYASYSPRTHIAGVIQKGERPTLDPKWPISIQNMLNIGWSPDPSVRPSMSTFYGALQREVATQSGSDKTSLDHSRRRSTHVMTPTNSNSSEEL